MEKIWIYVAVFMIGMVVGIILWEKLGTGDTYKGKVKIKQRGRSNEQSTPIKVSTGLKTSRKEQRKQRRIDKLKEKL